VTILPLERLVLFVDGGLLPCPCFGACLTNSASRPHVSSVKRRLRKEKGNGIA
jgi:hypothetical protein